jgi:hypothetical protein
MRSARNAAWRRAARVVALVALAAAELAPIVPPARAQQQGAIRSQSGQTLELAPNLAGQQPRAQAPRANDDNTRVIPVIPPNSQVMVLPQASTDFIGKWGGHIALTHHYGSIEPPADNIVSLLFGSRDGHVVLATTVFGGENAQILDTHADSDGPRAVTVNLTGLEISTRPPLRHVEKLSLELKGNNEIECRKLVDIYITGIRDPVMEAEYEGTLHPLTRREDRILTEEVLRMGVVPRGRIEEGNPPRD